MTDKKKIALLNLQVDHNFGGHLQRYALITALQHLGCDVVHLNTRFPSSKKPLLKILKGGVKRLLLYPYYAITRSSKYLPFRLFKYYFYHEPATEAFYDKYIPHTSRIFSYEELAQYTNFDCFIVGSDQVWRKSIASNYGLFTYMFDYLSNDKSIIAYGASLGTSNNELSNTDVERFRELYSRFKAVSVREISGLDLLDSYECSSPKAECVLDPTLLLTPEDYNRIINSAKTNPLKEQIFCYILDEDEQKKKCIQDIAKEKGYEYSIWTRDKNYTIEQWLRSIRDAKLIITDSYHGLLFSLIFNKEFRLLRNDYRGNARFESIASTLGVNLDAEQQDYIKINKNIANQREQSLRFLENSLNDRI